MTKKKLDYRWVIAITCFVTFFLVLGLGNSPHSLYIVPVTENFGFTRGDFSLVFSIITGAGLIIQLFYGVIVQRVGVRMVISIGTILVPIGYFLFSRATTLLMFYLGAVLVGIGLAFASITSVSILVNNWFDKGQGTILGVISAGSGFGGSLFTMIIGKYIAAHGFQNAYLLTAIILAFAVLPVILFIRSKPPSKIAQTGEKESTNPLVPGSTRQSKAGSSVFKLSQNWLAILAVLLIGIAIHPVLINTPAYLIEKGFDSVFAANISSSIFFVMAVAKIGLGYINDRLGIHASLYLGLGSFVISIIILILASSPWMVWIFVVFNGIAVASLSVLVPLYARALLGNENYSRYLGIFIATLSGGISIGVPVINYAYDLSGSYTLVIMIFAVLGLIALILADLSLKLKDRNQRELVD